MEGEKKKGKIQILLTAKESEDVFLPFHHHTFFHPHFKPRLLLGSQGKRKRGKWREKDRKKIGRMKEEKQKTKEEEWKKTRRRMQCSEPFIIERKDESKMETVTSLSCSSEDEEWREEREKSKKGKKWMKEKVFFFYEEEEEQEMRMEEESETKEKEEMEKERTMKEMKRKKWEE